MQTPPFVSVTGPAPVVVVIVPALMPRVVPVVMLMPETVDVVKAPLKVAAPVPVTLKAPALIAPDAVMAPVPEVSVTVSFAAGVMLVRVIAPVPAEVFTAKLLPALS